jgi:hypothetical protein
MNPLEIDLPRNLGSVTLVWDERSNQMHINDDEGHAYLFRDCYWDGRNQDKLVDEYSQVRQLIALADAADMDVETVFWTLGFRP